MREDADAAFADAAAQAECCARADVAGGPALGTGARAGACGHAAADGNGLRLGNADYVVSIAVGRAVGVGVGPDGVVEGLDDGFGGLVVPGGAGTEAGAATIDAEGGGEGGKEEGNGGEGKNGAWVVHFELVWVLEESVWGFG